MTAAIRALAGLSQPAAAPPGELITRWDDFSLGGNQPLAGRTAQGANGGWVWQRDNDIGNVYFSQSTGLQRSSIAGFTVYYTDVGAGNVNILYGWKMWTSAGFNHNGGPTIRAVDEQNQIVINSWSSGAQLKEVNNGADTTLETLSTLVSATSQWFRLTESAGTTLFEYWNNPANSSTPPTLTADLTGRIDPKFLTATKVGVGQYDAATSSRNVGQDARIWAANDPALLPTDVIGPIP